MPRFVFKLQGVLRHREHLEREKQRALAAIEAQRAAIELELRRANDTVAATTEDVRKSHLTGVLDMNFLAAHRRFLFAMQRKSLEIVRKLSLVQRQVDEARNALAQAAMQRKVMEKLREKHLQRWKDEEHRKEMIEQDEVAMQLARRNRSGDPAAVEMSESA